MKARRLIVAAASAVVMALIFAGVLFKSRQSPASVAPSVQATPAAPATSEERQAAAHENAFGFDLLRTLDKDAGAGNTFLSPLSIDQAVSMLVAGADGQTLAEIEGVLHTGGAGSSSLAQAGTLRDRLLAQGGGADPQLEINVANALWANRGIMLRPAYVDACSRKLGAQATTLDFSEPSAADTINRWVSTNTRGKIDSIVNSDDLASASAVLTNAVYFHGKWRSPFDESQTQDAPFTLASGAQKTLPMMTQSDSFPAEQTDELQAVELPYGRSGLSMVIVLPRAGHSVSAVAQSLTPDAWNQLMSSLHRAEVDLYLPRFHVDYSAELGDTLTTLGMGRVFTPAAQLSPMSDAPLYVSRVIHKTTLDVDEKGTLATAVTGIIAVQSAVEVPGESMTIRVDHPFLCAIRDDTTGALLFLGCVRDPQALR